VIGSHLREVALAIAGGKGRGFAVLAEGVAAAVKNGLCRALGQEPEAAALASALRALRVAHKDGGALFGAAEGEEEVARLEPRPAHGGHVLARLLCRGSDVMRRGEPERGRARKKGKKGTGSVRGGGVPWGPRNRRVSSRVSFASRIGRFGGFGKEIKVAQIMILGLKNWNLVM